VPGVRWGVSAMFYAAPQDGESQAFAIASARSGCRRSAAVRGIACSPERTFDERA
jgi:hypothetical protein